MADSNSTQVQNSAEQEAEPKRMLTPGNVMRELWNATDEGRRLSREQLQWMAGAGDVGTMMLRHLQTVLTGAGCLILGDSENKDLRTGSLQSPEDVADLLFMAENLIDSAAGMIEIGSEAGFKAYDKRFPACH